MEVFGLEKNLATHGKEQSRTGSPHLELPGREDTERHSPAVRNRCSLTLWLREQRGGVKRKRRQVWNGGQGTEVYTGRKLILNRIIKFLF